MGFEAGNGWHGQKRKSHLHLNDNPNPVLMSNSILCFFSLTIKFGCWLIVALMRCICGGFNKDKIKPEMRVRP